MWPRDAYVGQKVVAVYRGKPDRKLRALWRRLTGANDPYFLSEGSVYTVAKLGIANGVVRVFVAEKPADAHYGFACFRPVQPLRNRTETGMALIRTALDTVPDKKPVPAKEDV